MEQKTTLREKQIQWTLRIVSARNSILNSAKGTKTDSKLTVVIDIQKPRKGFKKNSPSLTLVIPQIFCEHKALFPKLTCTS